MAMSHGSCLERERYGLLQCRSMGMPVSDSLRFEHNTSSRSRASITMEERQFMVAIDLTTSFSGFAYGFIAHNNSTGEPRLVEVFQGETAAEPYCKAMKLLWYVAGSDTDDIAIRQSSREFVKHVRDLSVLIMADLRYKFGNHISGRGIRWCLTVPSCWDESATKALRDCAEMAGLVQGPLSRENYCSSVHPLVLVAEPQAASAYCLLNQVKVAITSRQGSRFLLVHAGVCRVRLVILEHVESSGLNVKEVANAGDPECWGVFADKAFATFLAQKIGCMGQFDEESPAAVLQIAGLWAPRWLTIKNIFDSRSNSYEPAWERREHARGVWSDESLPQLLYENLVTRQDVDDYVAGEMSKIMQMIHEQLIRFPELEAIMVVGGFANSRCLLHKIRDAFSSRVNRIISPPNPQSAASLGTLSFAALAAQVVRPRKSRRTYGLGSAFPFQAMKNDPVYGVRDDKGMLLCKNRFAVYVRRGDEIPIHHQVKKLFSSVSQSCQIIFCMYSTSDPSPTYVTEKGMLAVGCWTCSVGALAHLNQRLLVEVSMVFGREFVEVFAEPKNYAGDRVLVCSFPFELEVETAL